MTHPPHESRQVRQTFGPRLEHVREARELARQTVTSWGWEPTIPAMVVDELVVNAIIHGRTPFTVELKDGGDHIYVAVEDENPRLPVLTPVPVGAQSGRGLSIVAGLARSWGVKTIPDIGKIVWADLDGEFGSH